MEANGSTSSRSMSRKYVYVWHCSYSGMRCAVYFGVVLYDQGVSGGGSNLVMAEKNMIVILKWGGKFCEIFFCSPWKVRLVLQK